MMRGEVEQYSRLMYEARELALSRMQAEADALGADGVVAVKLNIEYMHGNEWMEVTAIGTAVKFTGAPHNQAQVTLPVG